MQERFKCFSVKILDYYNITVHSLVYNKLSVPCISLHIYLSEHTEMVNFCVLTPCRIRVDTDTLGEHAASIFTLTEFGSDRQ